MAINIGDILNAGKSVRKLPGIIGDFWGSVSRGGDAGAQSVAQARRVAKGMGREDIIRAYVAGKQGLPEAIDIADDSAAKVQAINRLRGSSGGRAYLGRTLGRPVPTPADAQRGLREMRVQELYRAGKPLKAPKDANMFVRTGRFALRNPVVSVPVGLAGGMVGLGLLAGRGDGLSRPEGLTESDMQALLGMVGSGATPESIINQQYDKAIAAASKAGAVDPELERYLTSRATQYEQDVLNANNAYAQALAELSGQAAGGYGGGNAVANQMAQDIAADTGTAVSSLTPISGELATAPQDTRASVASQTGQFAARDKMLNEDLAYLSGVAQLMGVEGAADIRRNLEDTLQSQAILARANARESANILEQQRLEDLGRINLEKVQAGSGALSAPQIEQYIYQYANEWASFTPQQKAIEASRRGLPGASEQELQRGYIESRLRQDGIAG